MLEYASFSQAQAVSGAARPASRLAIGEQLTAEVGFFGFNYEFSQGSGVLLCQKLIKLYWLTLVASTLR